VNSSCYLTLAQSDLHILFMEISLFCLFNSLNELNKPNFGEVKCLLVNILKVIIVLSLKMIPYVFYGKLFTFRLD